MLATINRGHEIWHLPKIHALLFSGKSNNTLYTINLHEVWFPKKQWLPFNDPWSTVQQTNATFFCLHLFQRRASVSFLRVHWTGAPLARIQKESNSKPQTQSTSVFRYDWMSTDEGDTCIFIQIYMYCINPAEAYKSQQSFNWGNGIQTDQTQRPTTPNIHMIFSANIARHRKIQQVFIKCSCLYWYCGEEFQSTPISANKNTEAMPLVAKYKEKSESLAMIACWFNRVCPSSDFGGIFSYILRFRYFRWLEKNKSILQMVV